MRGIPVGERDSGEHLLCGTIGEAPVVAETIEAGKSENAAFHLPRFGEEDMLGAAEDIGIGWSSEEFLADGELLLVPGFDEGIGSDGALDDLNIGVGEEEARMLRLQRVRTVAARQWRERRSRIPKAISKIGYRSHIGGISAARTLRLIIDMIIPPLIGTAGIV